mgnify:CR=1 FL=1
MINGTWHLSIVPVEHPPIYRASSADLSVGDMIITTNTTNQPGNYTVTNSKVYSDQPSQEQLFVSGGKYHVTIVVYPYETLVLDTVVEVR